MNHRYVKTINNTLRMSESEFYTDAVLEWVACVDSQGAPIVQVLQKLPNDLKIILDSRDGTGIYGRFGKAQNLDYFKCEICETTNLKFRYLMRNKQTNIECWVGINCGADKFPNLFPEFLDSDSWKRLNQNRLLRMAAEVHICYMLNQIIAQSKIANEACSDGKPQHYHDLTIYQAVSRGEYLDVAKLRYLCSRLKKYQFKASYTLLEQVTDISGADNSKDLNRALNFNDAQWSLVKPYCSKFFVQKVDKARKSKQ